MTKEKLTLVYRLSEIQKNLKAPKGQKNSFGNYKYRSCEDILEAVKPLLKGLVLTIEDNIELIGDRYYVKATAVLNGEKDEGKFVVSAYAREGLEKKGMAESQITGATSSYARKYALGGMFLIDDTKDADTNSYQAGKPATSQQSEAIPSPVSKAQNGAVVGLESLSENQATPSTPIDISSVKAFLKSPFEKGSRQGAIIGECFKRMEDTLGKDLFKEVLKGHGYNSISELKTPAQARLILEMMVRKVEGK